MAVHEQQRERWEELTTLLDRVDRGGVEALTVDELKRLCQLYRHVTIDLSRARYGYEHPELVGYLNYLAARAHGCVYRTRGVDVRPLFQFVVTGFPRLVRSHARPILVASAAFVLTSLASFLAVLHQPDLAYSLYDDRVVEHENLRLEQHEGEYRGNFTFDVAESPLVAVAIIGNNIRVAVIAFSLGCLFCLPGILLLAMNGRMLGTISGLVWNGGFFLDFYALVLTHGVLELTAICIAGGAGLALGWSLIAPGRSARREALRQAAGGAFGLLAGCALMLIVAGLLEAYVTPHFPKPVRWSVAAGSALFLILYLGCAGRRQVIRARERLSPDSD